MERLLRKEGHEVTWAASIKESIAAARVPFDLLVSDIGLPDGSGYDLMRTLRAKHPELPGIALSGYGSAEDVKRAIDAGFGEHVTKPIRFDSLREALARIANPQRSGGKGNPSAG